MQEVGLYPAGFTSDLKKVSPSDQRLGFLVPANLVFTAKLMD
jgi:hypothetical protein